MSQVESAVDNSLEETVPDEIHRRTDRANPYLPYRQLLTPQRVRELSQLRPIVPIIHTMLNWLCIIGAWVACAYNPAWPVVLLAIPVVGNRYYSLFIIGHDAFHRRIFPNFTSNDLFADLFIAGPLGAITRINKQNHLSHHTHLATPDDPDRSKHTCFGNSEKSDVLGHLTGVTTILRSIRSVYFKPLSSGERRSTYTRRDLGIIIGWQLGLIGGLSYFIGWWAYPVLWLIPVFLFTYLADGFRSFAEHSQPYNDKKADDHRLIVYTAPRWERTLFAPMNMNFHAVHHLWPSIPYYNLPIASRELFERLTGNEDIEWRDSYIDYFRLYFSKLPLVECREP